MDETMVPLSAAQVIGAFYASSALLRHPALRSRARRVRGHLEVYLDTEAERWLTSNELTLVEAERQVDPADAVARVTGPEALVATLPGFVDRDWLMPTVPEARVQLRVVAELVRWLVATGLVDRHEMACSVLEIEVRLDLASAWLDERARAEVSPSGRRAPSPPGSAP
ncbi:hypothetical protein [Georgenia sp. SYP-B2076]|uniref:hypothetical protein n=1 Tax=Georgenia sp. SYP-B2076 TaxID=2495881 RepID=UPI000F8E4A2A|nr:hypothetical protein [Georgenia sp. SYP-B2076]